jgi:alkylation response protein AidB-like acyl-CoA dehydrogenase
MEFGWTPQQNDYRQRVRTALDELLPDNWDEFYVQRSYASDEAMDFSRWFCPELAKRGLLVPHWPTEYGGNAGEDWEHFILGEEMKAAGEPRGGQYMNINWIGPVLMKYGTEEQKREHLSGIASGKVIWCQGFSEPNAGTDLAALKTKAERRDDHYVVNGGKIWTSYARKADWCILLVRTGPERKDITVLLVPMSSPGIRVASYAGLVKDGHLNEVFFEDVRVPVSSRVGEENRGWEIITHALSYERVGVPRYHVGLQALDMVVEKLQSEGRWDDTLVQTLAGELVAKFEAARLLTYRVVDQRVKRLPPNTDANLSRICSLEAVQDLMDFIAQFAPDALAGDHLLLDDYYRINTPAGITGGTNEIQLDLVAQRGLGLPRK